MKIVTVVIDFFADEVLQLKRYPSPLLANRVSKKRLKIETKFLNDIDSIESSLFPKESVDSDQDEDFRFFELSNRISSEGKESASKEEIQWLKDYGTKQNKNWK